ncbi:hypothetical protein [Isoptericola nanjingensis]|uniref:hypothetical protein n=1 Tax=Isoptericola TaxID=254250 RepID=UPI0035EB3A80|nr:hypothetical protein [Isoptericola sp. QY 916]
MPTPPNGSNPVRRKKIETPVLIATLVCVILAVVGAFAGFEVLGELGAVPVLVVLIVVVFVVGAVLTVRRAGALRAASTGGTKD